MLPWESEVLDCVRRLIAAVSPEARAELRRDLLAAERADLLAPGTPSDLVPIRGSYADGQ